MGKPKNEWAEKLARIVGESGYTIISYESNSIPIRKDGDEKEQYRTVVDLRLLPPKN